MKLITKPLISVIIPVYNSALYLDEALNSILNQTIQDFEIIIIDDCSTDSTIDILDNIKDARIKIFKKDKNKGLIDSLNFGFKIAQGKYIARMDGDDISLPTRFEKQLHVLENNPEIQICGCWLRQFGKIDRIIKHKEFHEEIVARMLLHCAMTMGSVMMERKAVKIYKFDISKIHVEDYDFWSRIAWDCKFYNIQEVLYLYRMHNTQVTEVHKNIQLASDIPVKLFLFKKLNYDQIVYSDELITKMLLLKEHIKVKELVLFIDWLKKIDFLNTKYKVYSVNELKIVLNEIKYSLLFTLYFRKTNIGIDKKWRTKAIFRLPLKEIVFILKLKSSELKKTL